MKEVYSALKYYNDTAKLSSCGAEKWPAVGELMQQNLGVVTAIHQILEEASRVVAATYPHEIKLIREHYLENKLIKDIIKDHNFHKTTFYRHCKPAIERMGLVIDDLNRQAELRRSAQDRQHNVQYERFLSRLPVLGFEQISSTIADYLVDEAGPAIVVIEGMGGLGKTTLAQLIAQKFVGTHFTAVLWASARQVDLDIWFGIQRTSEKTSIDKNDIILDLAKELNISIPTNIDSIWEEVRLQCKQNPYLIVIDNIETIADIKALAPIIENLAVPSRILITTRERVADTLSANVPRIYVPLNELDATTSHQLLRAAAQYTDAPGLLAASEEDLNHIYSIIGGNPLALWLVAGQAHGIPWTTFIQNLTEYCPPMSKGYQLYDFLYRHSWDLLSANAKQLLFVMHRCELGATYDLLLKMSELDRGEFEIAREELGNRMLLMFDGRQYYIHRLTYTFLRVVIAGWWE